MIRYRATEIEALEIRLGGISPLSCITVEKLGIGFLKSAIIVGVAHEFIGKKGKDGKLTDREVCRWIDESDEKDGVPYDELQAAVIRAVVGGYPNGQKMLDMMDEDEEGLDEGNGETGEED